MSLSTRSKVSWTDIQNLYTAMNTERKRFSMSTVTIPNNPGLTIPEHVATLNSLVNAMSSISFLTNVAVTGVVVPSRQTRLFASPFTRIADTIEDISNVCIHCGDFSQGCSFSDSGCSGATFGFDGGCKRFTHARNENFACSSVFGS